MLEQVQDHRHGNVVRQIRHECGGFGGELGDPHGIGEDQMEIPDGVRPPLGDGGRKFAGEDRIDLDGDNRPGGVQQAQGEGPEPRPDFQYRLVRVDVRGGDDPADGVAVNDEVLAEGLGGPDPDLLGQPADIGGPHQGCGCARRRADRLSHPGHRRTDWGTAWRGGGRFSHLGILSRRRPRAWQRPGPLNRTRPLPGVRCRGQPLRRPCEFFGTSPGRQPELRGWRASFSWRLPSRSPTAAGRAGRRRGWRYRSAGPWWPGWRSGRRRRRRIRARSGCRTEVRRSSRCRC